MFVGARRLAVAALVAGLVAGTAGCSGSSAKPPTLPPLSTTPAASTATPSPQSEKAELAAATAVVREYFRRKNSLGRTMDSGRLAALETSDCPCRKFLDSIRETAARHERYFGKSHILSVRATADSQADVEVLVTYNTTRGGTIDSNGNVLTRGPSRHHITALFNARLVGTRWLIADIVTIRPGTTS